MPQCNTAVHMKRSVCDCGHAFASKKRKARCTAVGEPENAMKHIKALLSEEELLVRNERDKVRKVSNRASEICEQTLHRQEQNQTHMASMRASETFQQTLHMQQQDRVHKGSIRATETPSEMMQRKQSNKEHMSNE